MSAGERLVTVLVTVAVPDAADPEDAAALLADAASSSALEVVHAAGVGGHLPAPGALVLRAHGAQQWRVQAVSEGSAALADRPSGSGAGRFGVAAATKVVLADADGHLAGVRVG